MIGAQLERELHFQGLRVVPIKYTLVRSMDARDGAALVVPSHLTPAQIAKIMGNYYWAYIRVDL